MSWHCLQEPGGGFSVEKYLDGVRSERARLRSTRERCCLPDSEMACLSGSRFGMMCARSMGGRGGDALMLSAGDSRAKTSAPPEKEPELREPGVGRVADGVAHRVDRLKAIGNGQVPLVAATAFYELLRRFEYGAE